MNYQDILKVLAGPAFKGVPSLQALPEAQAVFILAAAQSLDVAQSYKIAFPETGSYSLAELAASALLKDPTVQKAWNDLLKALLMGEDEALIRAGRMARDNEVHPRDRISSLNMILRACGVFNRDSTQTWRIKTATGTTEEAILELARELK
jgi:hypothetical protein